MKQAVKMFVLFSIGGTVYTLLEVLWRGHSHYSMFILGGICFVLIGLINEYLSWDMGLIWQSLIGAVIVIVFEFLTGLIVNVWLGLGVWDYSHLPFNIIGQVCLSFFLLWIVIACFAILLDDYIRYWFFSEEKPHYKLI